MLVITEFHVQVPKEVANEELYYDVFVPAGGMLNNSFKPKSYFDIVLFTTVLPYDPEGVDEDRYKFVTVRREPFDARTMNLFADVSVNGMMPNNMQVVLDRVRPAFGLDSIN